MKATSTSIATLLVLLISPFFVSAALTLSHHPSNENFLKCLTHYYHVARMFRTIYTPKTSSYLSVFQISSINHRILLESKTKKPMAIITPFGESQIQNVIFCCRKYGVQMRIRSGGHDYEGLSSVSRADATPFVILDLRHLRSVSIDAENQVAWVGGGATLGEFYYALVKTAVTLAFSAGLCPTVGVGGHFSGGGYGMMSRKFGLASDNVIDAKIIDAKGRVLNRKTMGEDLFWAIRGGGASSFGVVTAWKLKLASVPKLVTVFTVTKLSEQNATQLIHRWQYVANKMDKNLLIRVSATSPPSSQITRNKRTILAFFIGMFLGRAVELIPLMQHQFPELGVAEEDCTEMSWGESLLYFSGYYNLQGGQQPMEALIINRTSPTRISFKAKSDFLQQPIPEKGIQGILNWLLKEDPGRAVLYFEPLGGRFDEISESETPFPYRSGYLYVFDQLVIWDNENGTGRDLQRWANDLYQYMTPHVSKNPRGAYYNVRDLDLGVNTNGFNATSYKEASVWGLKYFKNNFERLARVKAAIDPVNFFRDEQSIPPLFP